MLVKRLLLTMLGGLLLTTVFVVYRAGATMARIERQEMINGQLAVLDDLLQDMLNAETGQRGYLLTGQALFLESYRAAVGRLRGNLRQLLEVDTADTVGHGRLLRLNKLVELKLGDLDDTLKLAEHNKRTEALALVQSDLGRLYMDEMRQVVRDLSRGLVSERSGLTARVVLAVARARVGVLSVMLAFLVFVALAARTVLRTQKINAGLLQRLADEATHDVLTGLPNRRYLSEWLTHNMALAGRDNTTVGVFFIDLDGFKAINDRFGHDAGDRVLLAVAGSMRSMLRQSDFVARLGGDEFAVVTIDRVGDSSLVRLGERLIETISALDLRPDAAPGSLGASVGIAVFPSDGDSAEQLLQAADAAMYTAKRRGKGQVRLVSDTQTA